MNYDGVKQTRGVWRHIGRKLTSFVAKLITTSGRAVKWSTPDCNEKCGSWSQQVSDQEKNILEKSFFLVREMSAWKLTVQLLALKRRDGI